VTISYGVKCSYSHGEGQPTHTGAFLGLVYDDKDNVLCVIRPDTGHGLMLALVHPSRVTITDTAVISAIERAKESR
jgi:hypothetical protein